MKKVGKKRRNIKYWSNKISILFTLHSDFELKYVKTLEEDEKVISYEVGVPLDKETLSLIQKTGIRKEYLTEDWITDFAITYQDGSLGVREVVRPLDLEKRAEIEKLEISRRYWKYTGAHDWKIVMEG